MFLGLIILPERIDPFTAEAISKMSLLRFVTELKRFAYMVNSPKIISIAPLVTEKRSFKKLKILSVLAHFISKIKKSDIFKFLSVKYFGKRSLFPKI